MRLTVGNAKGGTGKTTTAVMLALGLAREGRTLLVDADPQQSALDWSEQAAEEGDFPPVVVAWSTRDLGRRVEQVADDYDHLVIDTPPSHPAVLRSALTVAPLLLVPLAPTLLEASRLLPTFDLAEEVNGMGHDVTVRVLLTRVRTGTRSAREVRSYLTENKMHILKAQIPLTERLGMAYGTVPADLGAYSDVLAELETV